MPRSSAPAKKQPERSADKLATLLDQLHMGIVEGDFTLLDIDNDRTRQQQPS